MDRQGQNKINGGCCVDVFGGVVSYFSNVDTGRVRVAGWGGWGCGLVYDGWGGGGPSAGNVVEL